MADVPKTVLPDGSTNNNSDGTLNANAGGGPQNNNNGKGVQINQSTLYGSMSNSPQEIVFS